jgi:type II secretory pathway pseudopilin PulG
MMKLFPFSQSRRPNGFSLVEIVLAVGVFAITIVAVIGLLSPTLNQVSESTERATVNRMADLITHEVQRLGFDFFSAQVPDVDSLNPEWVLANEALFFVSAEGDIISLGQGISRSNSAIPQARQPFTREFNVNEAFFAVDFRRHGRSLNPGGDDQRAAIAYQFRIVWPAYQPNGVVTSIYTTDRNNGRGTSTEFRRLNSVTFNGAVRR